MKADLLYVKDIEKVQVQDMKSEVCLLLTDWMSKLCFGVGFCLFFFCFLTPENVKLLEHPKECYEDGEGSGEMWMRLRSL